MILDISNYFDLHFKLYIKHEGNNPTGTQKDRVAKMHVLNCSFLGIKKMVAASCGNFGVALCFYGARRNLEVEIYIPTAYESPRVREIEEFGGRVVRYPGTYEECVKISSEIAKENGWYNANPGKENVILEYWGYSTIFKEIIGELPQVSCIGVPVSNGVTIGGLGFAAKLYDYKIRFVAGSCLSNPIALSVERHEPYKPLEGLIQNETEINEPLINWDSLDGSNAVRVIQESQGFAMRFSDEELLSFSNFLNERIPLSCHPASVAGLLAILARKSSFTPDTVAVGLITSKNY